MDILTMKLMLQDLILAKLDDSEGYSDEYMAGYNCALSNIAVDIESEMMGTHRISDEVILNDRELGIRLLGE